MIARIKAVGREGAGNVEASAAWKELVAKGPTVLLEVLAGLDDASPAAANWLRAAVDSIADEALAAGKAIPAAKLEAFVIDTRHAGHGRRLAYEWLNRVDATAAERLLPKMLDDPGSELRREAVAVQLKTAQKLFDAQDKKGATGLYQKLLEAARDRDQVQLIAERLKKLGVEVDLATRFGFVSDWMLLGPFDNTKGVGFNNVYPPEKAVVLGTTYVGKENQKLRWFAHTTADAYGVVDINKAIGHLKGAVAYGYTVVLSPSERPVELRAGSNNAIRIFLNGKEVFFREEYHHGMRMDQHLAKGVLKAGRNEILIKVCQNEQTEEWAQRWSFQLRICDAIGGPVPVSVVKGK